MSHGSNESGGQPDGDEPLVLAPEADAPQDAYGSDPEADTKPNPGGRSGPGESDSATSEADGESDAESDAE